MATAAEHTLVAAFLEQMPDLICFKDRDHRCIGGSQSLANRHGVGTVAQLTGLRDEDLFSPEYARLTREEEGEVMALARSAVKRTEQIRWPDGRLTWSRATKLPLRDGGGAIIGTIEISEDCTAVRATEQSLERVQKELVGASRQAGMAEVASGVLTSVDRILESLNGSASALAATLSQSRPENVGELSARLKTPGENCERLAEQLAGLSIQLESERASLLAEVEQLHRHIDHIKTIVAQQQAYARRAGAQEKLAAP